MVKKKESPPPALMAVRILTLDYLIDGYVEDQALWPAAGTQLTSVRLEPTGSLVPPASTAANWLLLSTTPVVAGIPRDAASEAYLRKRYDTEFPLPVQMYVGPYLIQGKLLRRDATTDPFKLAATYKQAVLVQEAVIDCLLPGARLKQLSAPLALVRTEHLLQGMVLLQ